MRIKGTAVTTPDATTGVQKGWGRAKPVTNRGRYRRFVDPGRCTHCGCGGRRNLWETEHMMRCPLDPARVLTGESVTSSYRSSI